MPLLLPKRFSSQAPGYKYFRSGWPWVCIVGTLLFTACFSGNKDTNNGADFSGSFTKDTAAVSALLVKASSFNQTNFDSMRHYAAKALEVASVIPFPVGIARAKAIEANYQRRKGNYPEAIAIGLQVLNVYDSLKLWQQIVNTKNLLADFYKEMGGEKRTGEFQRKGLDLSKEAQQIAEREKYYAGVINSLNEQGIILRDMSETIGRKDLMDSAFALYSKGIEIITTTGQGEDQLGKLYNNISQVYNEHYHDYKKALTYQMQAVEFNTKRNNQISLTHNYNTITEVYMNMGDLHQADLYAHKMLALSQLLKAPFRLVNACAVLRDLNKKMGRYDSALYYYEMGVGISDSINNLEKTGQIAEMQTRYETKEKEERIGSLNKLNQTKSQRLWVLGGAALLLSVLLFVVWMQKRRSQQQQQQISRQSEKLQWMMKELHHRVKNNLQIVSSLLNLQSYRLHDEESKSAIRESQLRVQAMSLMHQRLYMVEDVTMVNFKLYLADLAETLMKAYGYGPDNFDLQLDIKKEMLDVDTVMPMGLLVNEIITNSFKYAYGNVSHPSLIISMDEKEGQLQLTVSDNGPGIQAGSQNGFGKKLIEALTKQLKATCAVSAENGTRYTLHIPYKQKAA